MRDRQPKFKWDARRELAAELVARDDMTDDAIAKQVGVTKRSLERWKQSAEFMNRVDGIVADFRERVKARGIAIMENRVARQHDTRAGLLQVVAARQAAALDQHRAHEMCTKERREMNAELAEVNKRIEARRRRKGVDDLLDEARAAADTDRAKAIGDQLRILEDADPGPLHPGQETGLLVREVTYSKNGMTVKWSTDTATLGELDRIEDLAARELGQRSTNVKHSGSIGRGVVDLTKLADGDLDALDDIIAKATTVSD